MNHQYQDFQILVDKNNNIRASSEQGEVSGKLQLNQRIIKPILNLIELREANKDLHKDLGNELYKALFPDQVNARFHATMAGAQAGKSSVRLRLIFESPELASLPWEFLYDEHNNIFLANNTDTVLSRYIDVPLQKREIKAASLPLKILLVISSPTDLATLDTNGEEKLIRQALGKHIEAGDIELDVLKEATRRNIQQKLREKPYNVFHFIGHGVFENNTGNIILVDEDGKSKYMDDENFANFFLGNNHLGLVILNSCEGATVSSNQVFAGAAPNLVRRGIPAVVAMQYKIADSTAKLFADEFYRTLALGYPVDAAIQTTRNAISMEVGLDRRDFATPVLYMRAKDGIILSGLDEESKPTPLTSIQQIRIENLKQELEKRKIDYQAVYDKKIIENNPEVEHNLELQLQNIAKKMEKIEQQLQELSYGDV
ncbi:MAG: CHAT domain-containing protein [Rivularia sp. (in: cyanobacteria)]